MSNDNSSATYVLCSVIEFTDDTVSVQELHRGTLEACEKIADLIPGIINTTCKPAINSWLSIVPLDKYEAAIKRDKRMDLISDANITWVTRSNTKRVIEIDRLAFGKSRALTEDKLLSEMIKRNKICMGIFEKMNMLGATHCQELRGFVIYSLHKRFIHIERIAVHPDWQRCGRGSLMVEKLFGKAFQGSASCGFKTVTVRLSERDYEAAGFFRNMGFSVVRLGGVCLDKNGAFSMERKAEKEEGVIAQQ